MMSLRNVAGVLGLAVLLAVTSCGQSDTPQASLEVSSVPVAEIYVDGVSQGLSPRTLSLAAGTHMVELRLEKFAPHGTTVTLTEGEAQKIDAILTAQDPSDPTVIAMLAEAEGFEVAPFIAPETTRGASRKQTCAVLLWPRRDVRRDGLVSYAIEADETYGGDATLEFRHGRKVLYREPFSPETVTTVRSIPAEVLECVKVGTKITWGLFFEDRRSPIKSVFHVVNRPKADRQLAKLASSRHMARQPEITRKIMQATILENNRLYTEALISNLTIASEHPNSIQPFRGIVTTLRRLDAKHSELFAFVSPNVAGKGGNAGFDRPSVSGRTAASQLGIKAWSPLQPFAAPTPPAGAGATPATPLGAESTTADPTPDADTPQSDQPDQAAETAKALERMSREIQAHATELADLQARADSAGTHAATAREAAESAQGEAQRAEAAATAAREAVEQSEDPTPEQQQAMAETGELAESARENADRLTAEAAQLGEAARLLDAQVQQRTEALSQLRKALDAASAGLPSAPNPEADQAALRAAFEQAQQGHQQAQTALESARTSLEQAQRAFEEDGSADNQRAFEAARTDLEKAESAVAQSAQDLEAARAAAAEVGNQVQDSTNR